MSDVKIISHLSVNPKGLTPQEIHEKTKLDLAEVEAIIFQLKLNDQIELLLGIRNNLPTRVVKLKQPPISNREINDEKELEEVKKETGENR